jgi:hypothetical protein
MEIYIDIWVETENLEIKPKPTKQSTFVAVDDTGRP